MVFPILMDEAVIKQFDDKDFKGTRVEWDKNDFVRRVNDYYVSARKTHGHAKESPFTRGSDPPLVAGNAPFVKHLVMANFTVARTFCMELTESNKQYLCSGYRRNRDDELMVLKRWFPEDKVQPDVGAFCSGYRRNRDDELMVLKRWFPEDKVQPDVGAFLDIVLYTKEQINADRVKSHKPPFESDATYYIVAIKAQPLPCVLPLQPEQILRNAFMRGLAMDRKEYQEAVTFWEKHALVGHTHDEAHAHQVVQLPTPRR
eukprot:CAMPEP_0184672432 /NCGR_PEP_ID=MMETSP0308-20130426/86095_1 /TAXON_ID=38269 /ORGANISM="Gloeochaete witrockiana, Strain SAG 46.84" /LENGTH=258 /DNA_ID=CAMNT_0027119759 /DNA_START=55 /DNA_END=831 /DNA_ORIENTATION=+